jgi:hypothetical protein
MARSSGDTLSLNDLAGATGITQGANVSLNAINGSAGTIVKIDDYGIDSVDASLSGYTYAVEGTSENYSITFGGAGSKFSTISSRHQNFTWAMSPVYNSNATTAGFLSIGSNPSATGTITVDTMNPQGVSSQTSLMSNNSHTISATFADNFNHHATRHNVAITKSVFSVDSYDGNSDSLCILVDTPVTLQDGSTIEAGDIVEGLKLQGYSFSGLSEDSDGDFYSWSSEEKGENSEEVEVVNVVFSFADAYYNINDGEIKATQDHPMLVKDSSDGLFRFKKIGVINENDKLVRKVDGILVESDITSIETVDETVEIVTIDVETQDTYLINGYVTHNKGGDSHSDLSAPGVPTNLAYTEVDNETHNITWDAVSGASSYRIQVDNNSDFSSPIIDEDEYNSTTLNVVTALSSGTFYVRVRAIDHGLNGNYTTTLTISR